MGIFKRKPKKNASVEIQEEQLQSENVKKSYESLAEALRGETVDDSSARETVFYKPGGNVIVSTVGTTVKIAFRVAKRNFESRFKWSTDVDAELSSTPVELSGYDIIHLYSGEESGSTKNTLQKIFRAYSLELLRDLEKDYSSVKRVKTEVQAEGQPSDVIRNMDILELDAQDLHLYTDDVDANHIEEELSIYDVNKRDIRLTLKDPGFIANTAEEKLVFTIAQRELTLGDAVESSELFIWSHIIAAVKSMFIHNVLIFEYPGKTVSNEELLQNILGTPEVEEEPDVEPEPEVEEAPVEHDIVEEDPTVETHLPEDIAEADTDSTSEPKIADFEIRPEDKPSTEGVQIAQGVSASDSRNNDGTPVAEKPLPDMSSDETLADHVDKVTENVSTGVDTVDTTDTATEDVVDAESADEQTQSDATSESLDEDTPADDVHAYIYDKSTPIADSIAQDNEYSNLPLPEIDIDDYAYRQQQSKAPTDHEQAASLLHKIRSLDHQEETSSTHHEKTDNTTFEERVEKNTPKTNAKNSAFDLNEVMLKGRYDNSVENSPLFERLAKERGIHISDN